MARASEVENEKMTGPDGEAAGTVLRLLLHPDGTPSVVGASVRPPAALVVVSRPETYLPLSALTLSGAAAGATTTLAKLPSTRASADALGFDPDRTVIWSGMPVAGPSGAVFGTVSDFEFDPVSGTVLTLFVGESVVAGAAYGKLEVPAEAIVGYSAGAVHISVEAPALDAEGGLAKAAAATVVSAAGTAAVVGDAVGGAVVAAGAATGRAIKAVKDSQVVEKAARSVGSTWRDSVKAFRDGMKDDG